MKERYDSKSQSLNAFIFATILIVLLLNLSFILPVPLVRAESEGQTCSACSCCQPWAAETSHYVTVNVVDGEILLQIEPLILPEMGCGCSQNQGCPTTIMPTNMQITVLQQDETYSVILLTYEVDGTTFEVTVTTTLLWSYNELTDQANKTARFISTEIVTQDGSWQFYSLGYAVQHVEYRLVLFTRLISLTTETYGSSFTMMNYAPANKTNLSLEFVEFNSSVKLSQQYAILGKVAKEIGKLYEKSGDPTLAKLAEGYYTMSAEGKYLSKLVENHLRIYNREILQSRAILMDARCSSDFDCQMMYGSEYCCIGGYCEVCPPAPPPGGGGGVPIECFWECFSCLVETGILISTCWPCVAACLTIFTFWTCALCLLTYCIIASLPQIWTFVSTVVSCYLCLDCLGYI